MFVVVAFLLPVVLILGIAGLAYIQPLFVRTQYNFVYATCGSGTDFNRYNCGGYLNSLYVEGGNLVVLAISPAQDSDNNRVPDVEENFDTRLFLHNNETNESREVTLQEAQKLTLSGLLTSPDGVAVLSSYDNNSDFFFIFGGGGSQYGYYLSKRDNRRKLNLINADGRYYYRDNFKFIGWVMP